jgi:hypothetical protein
VATGNFEWNNLSTILTDGKLSGDSPYGIRYVTYAKPKEFEFEDWGPLKIIGFMADGYFAGYIENTQVADKMTITSVDENDETITIENMDNAITLSKNKECCSDERHKHQDC